MCELTDEDTMARKDGIIALQIHAGPPMKVQFRNVRLKLFPKQTSPGGRAGRRSSSSPAARATVMPSTSTTPAACCWPSASRRTCRTCRDGGLRKGWPKDAQALDDAATIVIYCRRRRRPPVMQHLDEIEKLHAKGVGLACIHYAVEMPTGKAGDLLKSWIGGYFETFWSVNPDWKAVFKQVPRSPRGQRRAALSRSTTSGTITCVSWTT